MTEPDYTPPPSPIDELITKVKEVDYKKHLKTAKSGLITAGAWIQVTAQYTVRGFVIAKPHIASGLRGTANWLDSLNIKVPDPPPPPSASDSTPIES